MNRVYLQNSEPIEFDFYQNEKDFIVDEIPLGEFKGRGNFIIIHVKKVELTTWDMIAAFADFLKIPAQKIGYAGLKDKHATTTQYISVELKYEKELKKFRHPQIKILSTKKHTQSIQMGDLSGNRFSINLFNIDDIKAGRIEKLAKKAQTNGIPNYFGYQRFGRDGDSIEQAKEMIAGELHIADTKLKKFLTSVYQSTFFNQWLKERIELSQMSGKFVLLEGDVYLSKDSKLVTPAQIPLKDFEAKKMVPTGLLCGRGAFRARDEAREIEKKYDDEFLVEKGLRREALVYPQEIVCNYNKGFGLFNISFSLPKGSYATVFLESIANKNFTAKDVKKD